MTNQQTPEANEAPAPIGGSGDEPAKRGTALGKVLRQSGLAWVLVILAVAGSLQSPAFPTTGNLINLAREASLIGIVGIGVTFVILTAGSTRAHLMSQLDTLTPRKAQLYYVLSRGPAFCLKERGDACGFDL